MVGCGSGVAIGLGLFSLESKPFWLHWNWNGLTMRDARTLGGVCFSLVCLIQTGASLLCVLENDFVAGCEASFFLRGFFF